ncbi:hypothetical protein B0T09DRAFT_326889 [Sordaria sp. MPI-SDFR-AT-0083]|nr:hypothetical protein B0T09DRAFT_326889 [Sordaria sp. MPI-SDFR-AT-0083]
MSILPGYPFQDLDHFSATFSGVNQNGETMQHPDNERRQILIGLLSGICGHQAGCPRQLSTC